MRTYICREDQNVHPSLDNTVPFLILISVETIDVYSTDRNISRARDYLNHLLRKSFFYNLLYY